MSEKVAQDRSFVTEEVPKLLMELKEDTSPKWGKMTPQHLMEHLIITFKMAIGRIKLPVITPPEKWERIRQHLVSDSPMQKSVASPIGKNDLQPLRYESFKEARQKLIEEIAKYYEFIDQNPGFMASHPYGGDMTTDEWVQFNRKHFVHHLTQFGVLAEKEG